ncbi:MAG: HEAT repeat domain-containing protein [Chloroflexi bacterium]|nr:HEAT repeat domain-containing protein [Chloroflexota bacterium]
MLLPIEKLISDLANSNKPLSSSGLTELSNLSSEDMEFICRIWESIESKRRQQIIYRLVELAENNFELNFDSIVRNCLKDQDAEVRSKAIVGLRESEEASLINPLIDVLRYDSSEKVQVAATIVLGKFAMLAEHKKIRSCHISKLGEALLSVIGDRSKPVDVRRRALEAAAPLSVPQVRKIIVEAYQSRNSKIRAGAVYAMGKSCNHFWLPILLEELANADTEIRYEAARACGELGEEEAVPCLIELLRDPDTDVQLAAIQALGKIGSGEAKEYLEECLNNPNDLVQEAAEQSLEYLKIVADPFYFEA